MAGENRTADHPLIDLLERESFRFSFFQAVQLLERAVPGSVSVGLLGPADREAIRFQPELSMDFPTSDLTSVTRSAGPGGAPRFILSTTFLSLYGTSSPLPTYFTEQLLEQEEESLQRKFIDLFHHRILSLFYRVWAKYRLSAQFQEDGKDALSRRLLELLIGDPERLPPGHRVKPVRLLALGGAITQFPRSAATLAAALSEYFAGTPVEMENCVPRWLEIPEDQRNRLAMTNCRLGQDLSLGERVYDRSSTFRVSVGPVGLDDFLGFLPPGERIAELREIVDLMNGDALDYEVELCLKETEVPPLQLSSDRAMLGWSTWMGRRDGMSTRVRFLVKGWLHGRG
jgi:type VI secretion system protein ImpH